MQSGVLGGPRFFAFSGDDLGCLGGPAFGGGNTLMFGEVGADNASHQGADRSVLRTCNLMKDAMRFDRGHKIDVGVGVWAALAVSASIRCLIDRRQSLLPAKIHRNAPGVPAKISSAGAQPLIQPALRPLVREARGEGVLRKWYAAGARARSRLTPLVPPARRDLFSGLRPERSRGRRSPRPARPDCRRSSRIGAATMRSKGSRVLIRPSWVCRIAKDGSRPACAVGSR